jgi:hypothetical protein
MSVDSTSVGVEEATPSLMVDDFFQSAMHDFTGRARLESEDPRWSHLLRACASLRSLCGDEKELNAFMLRLGALRALFRFACTLRCSVLCFYVLYDCLQGSVMCGSSAA